MLCEKEVSLWGRSLNGVSNVTFTVLTVLSVLFSASAVVSTTEVVVLSVSDTGTSVTAVVSELPVKDVTSSVTTYVNTAAVSRETCSAPLPVNTVSGAAPGGRETVLGSPLLSAAASESEYVAIYSLNVSTKDVVVIVIVVSGGGFSVNITVLVPLSVSQPLSRAAAKIKIKAKNNFFIIQTLYHNPPRFSILKLNNCGVSIIFYLYLYDFGYVL